MSQTREPQYYPADEIDLRELFLTIWKGKWLILVTTVAFAAGGVLYALNKPNIYQANVLLAPVDEDAGGLGAIGGQLGGLASLAGINLGGGGSNQTVVAKEILQSRTFLTDFINRHKLEVPLMGTSGWSDSRKSWIYDRETFNPETGNWLLDDEGNSLKPTEWDLVKLFKENHLSISENKDTGMITLSVKSQSPPTAKDWAEKLVADINEHMRREDIADAENRIAYLQAKLSETKIAGMQQVFYQLIENETRTVMLANARQEYVFETVDPAVIPQEKSQPKRAIIAVVATVLGGAFGVLLVFVRTFIRGGDREKENL